MGGTSIWFTSLSIGIMLSVSKDIARKEKEKEELIHHDETVEAVYN
jgi:cell division protein FtsW (lipid II flippase)